MSCGAAQYSMSHALLLRSTARHICTYHEVMSYMNASREFLEYRVTVAVWFIGVQSFQSSCDPWLQRRCRPGSQGVY
jgi:hypothetical protein